MTTDRIDPNLVFAAGVVLGVLLLIGSKWERSDVKPLAGAALAGLVGYLLATSNGSRYDPLRMWASVFALTSFWRLRTKILVRVGESNLLLSCLVFWYLCASFHATGGFQIALMAVAVIPSVETVYVALVVREWSFSMKLLGYVWFLILNAAIALLLLQLSNLSFITGGDVSIPLSDVANLLTISICFRYLASNLFCLWVLLPFRGKNQTPDEARAEWIANATLVASRFADYTMSVWEVVFTVAVAGGLFLADFEFRVLPLTLLASVVFVFLRAALDLIFGRGGTVGAVAGQRGGLEA